MTFTGLFTNFNSFIPMHYKLGLLKSLIHRTFEISSDWIIFHSEVLNIKTLLGKNAYPPDVIDRQIKHFVNNKHKTSEKTREVENIKYFKLLYLESISKFKLTKFTISLKLIARTLP